MSDLKSKLPNLKELTSMACTLYEGIKGSVKKIVHDYNDNRKTVAQTQEKKSTTTAQDITADDRPLESEEKQSKVTRKTTKNANPDPSKDTDTK